MRPMEKLFAGGPKRDSLRIIGTKERMKHWIADFSIKYRAGDVATEEVSIRVEAENITIALGKALQYIDENYHDREKRGIEQIAIWNIGIAAEDDVF